MGGKVDITVHASFFCLNECAGKTHPFFSPFFFCFKNFLKVKLNLIPTKIEICTFLVKLEVVYVILHQATRGQERSPIDFLHSFCGGYDLRSLFT